MPPNITSTTIAVKNNKLLTSTNLVNTNHPSSHFQETENIIHSQKMALMPKLQSLWKKDEAEISKEVSGDDLEDETVTAASEDLEDKRDHSIGLREPSKNSGFQRII